jgi:hypothetical protein
LIFKKLVDRTDIIYQVQASTDLKTSTDVPDELVETLAEFETRRASILVTPGIEHYLRLKFSR